MDALLLDSRLDWIALLLFLMGLQCITFECWILDWIALSLGVVFWIGLHYFWILDFIASHFLLGIGFWIGLHYFWIVDWIAILRILDWIPLLDTLTVG